MRYRQSISGQRFIPARTGNTPNIRTGYSQLTVHPRAGGEHGGSGGLFSSPIGSSPRGRGTPAHNRNRTAHPPVHPRAGGEHLTLRTGAAKVVGSSPRGRGTRSAQSLPAVTGRFIPARAGNTPRRWERALPTPVHPRAGGEHQGVPRRSGCDADDGSSPRGRGTRARCARARGGSASGSSPRGRGTPDTMAAGPSQATSGSSPRGRGTLNISLWERSWIRFIPARAGNTRLGAPCDGRKSVHPRAGGEHRLRCPPTSRTYCLRFIPARAGNTWRGSFWSVVFPVHPRAGEEHSSAHLVHHSASGSSPRGRGTPPPRQACIAPAQFRFIPARAGNTCATSSSCQACSGHGSSPRGRGTRAAMGRPGYPVRFIPSRAGNTYSASPAPGAGLVHPRAGGEHDHGPRGRK